MKVRSITRYLALRRKLGEVEKELQKTEYRRRLSEEQEVIRRMESNPNYFYTFVKSKTKSKNKLGPFLDVNGNVIKEEVAETLQKQYKSVWTLPRQESVIEDPESFFATGADKEKPTIKNIVFTREKVLWAISQVSGDASAGPDGVSGNLLKNLKEEVADYLADIFQRSMESGQFLFR